MSPLHSALALGPLAVYLLLLGIINLSTRSLVTTGRRDWMALGMALTGLIAVGPLDLFMPESAASRFGPWIWPLLLGLYFLCLYLVVQNARPRLVIYNMTVSQMQQVLTRVVERIGVPHSWAGRSLSIPDWGVELHLDRFFVMRNVSLVASGPRQNRQGWHRLQQELSSELEQLEVAPNPVGLTLITFSLLLFVSLILRLWHNPVAAVHSLLDLLRM
ncbi:MAG: hypothetical protein K8T25_02705 [Planctomycetia bacterium]|nr:hypothetical protein [Planctomycetia bacterium]